MAFLDNGGESSPIEIDTLRNRYALTIRDEATGLADTWFRKLENRGGRWTSPDPYNGSANIGNGQSWNRYAYVGNEPTNYVDPSGLNSASRWSRPWGTYGGGFGEALFRWADNMWSSGGWSAEYSGGDHWAAEQGGIAFSGGDIGGLLNGPPLLPGIHINWSGGREPVILGFAVVHAMNPTLNNEESFSTGGFSKDLRNPDLKGCLKRVVNDAEEQIKKIKPVSLINLTWGDLADSGTGTIVGTIIGAIGGGIPGAAAGFILGYIGDLVSKWAYRSIVQFAINVPARAKATATLVFGTIQCYQAHWRPPVSTV